VKVHKKCIMSHKIPKKNFWGWGTAPAPQLGAFGTALTPSAPGLSASMA